MGRYFRIVTAVCLVSGLLLCAPARASAAEPDRNAASTAASEMVFPHSDELFHRLLADPRQAQTVVRYYRLQGFNLTDVALGNTWGILRWNDVLGTEWDAQWNLEGMAYSRFKLSGAVNEFQTIDFFGNIPMEVRNGIYSARLTLFHESSHLGDDYIRRTGLTGFRYSVEGMRLVGSVDVLEFLRLYGGAEALFHEIPGNQDGSLQAGFEIKTPDLGWIEGRPCWIYLAQDFSSKGRVGWNIDSNAQAGLRIGLPHVARATRFHVGYYSGHSQFGQFFRAWESYWSLGASFDF